MPYSPKQLTDAERTAQVERFARLRGRMLLTHQWYGALSLRLEPRADFIHTPTMSTNGSRLYFNPDAMAERTDAEVTFAIAHETLHCALVHPYRLGNRNIRKANIAMDYAINPILVQAGFTPWPGALIDNAYAGKAWEEIYNLLPNDPDNGEGNGQGNGSGKNNQQGQGGGGSDNKPPQPDVMAPGKHPGDKDGDDQDGSGESGSKYSDLDWKVAATNVTMQCQKAGTLPAGIDALIESSLEVPADWRAILRRFVTNILAQDYSWARPNRRFVSSGVYLPSIHRESMPKFGVGVDTSGSISDAELGDALEEVKAILKETHPEEVIVAYCDATVSNVERFGPDDFDLDFHPTGRGGTKFQPVFDYFDDEETDPIAAIIYFSADLENCDSPLTEPNVPVLWITKESVSKNMEFGETIRISD